MIYQAAVLILEQLKCHMECNIWSWYNKNNYDVCYNICDIVNEKIITQLTKHLKYKNGSLTLINVILYGVRNPDNINFK